MRLHGLRGLPFFEFVLRLRRERGNVRRVCVETDIQNTSKTPAMINDAGEVQHNFCAAAG